MTHSALRSAVSVSLNRFSVLRPALCFLCPGTTLTSPGCQPSVTRTWVPTWQSSHAFTPTSSTACQPCMRSTLTLSSTRMRWEGPSTYCHLTINAILVISFILSLEMGLIFFCDIYVIFWILNDFITLFHSIQEQSYVRLDIQKDRIYNVHTKHCLMSFWQILHF